ncbi:FAD-binding dehydrogenase [Saccharopolyspora spinosa]|uniref:FAD-binding dehydrogenase n=1 Tax=Saccharopolyspora spinosa TaxID=60894 RepID=UPI00374A4783
MTLDAAVIVVGAAWYLVATAELADAGLRVVLVDQEPEASLGGQAHWSFGGLFLVDSPEQRRLGVRDSRELALQDWLGSAGFDRPEDHWPRQWAEAYVDFAAGEKRAWLTAQGVRFFPLVQWAERGGYLATGHGNSVPRFHITWGTGPGVLAPFIRRVRQAAERELVSFRFRHRVSELITSGGAVTGVRGEVLAPSLAERGQPSSRAVAGDFELHAQAVVVASGGIGGNLDLVRRNWPERYGQPPKEMIAGVPDHVDGRMLEVVSGSGGHIINPDRMWHYTEGIRNYAPIWSKHGIRILPGPSSLWLDAEGRRLPAPLFPGFDTLGTMEHIAKSGHEYTWFVLNRRIISREFALSGSEQNPDLTERSLRKLLQRGGGGTPGPVAEFVRRGPDFVVRRTVAELACGMNDLVGDQLIDAAALEREIVARDRQVASGLGKDEQVIAIRAARRYVVDRMIRVAEPHRLLDPAAGPLIAVRLSILTRKTLGGLETDLSGRVLRDSGEQLPGLYAAGEVAGFGGGGVHGYRALEGTFLGGCLFSGRQAGRAAAAALG